MTTHLDITRKGGLTTHVLLDLIACYYMLVKKCTVLLIDFVRTRRSDSALDTSNTLGRM